MGSLSASYVGQAGTESFTVSGDDWKDNARSTYVLWKIQEQENEAKSSSWAVRVIHLLGL